VFSTTSFPAEQATGISGMVCGVSRRVCNDFPNPAANNANTMKNIEANSDIASGPIFSKLSASWSAPLMVDSFRRRF